MTTDALAFDKPSGYQGVGAYSSVTEQASGTASFGNLAAFTSAMMQDTNSQIDNQASLIKRGFAFTATKAQAAEMVFEDFIELVPGIGQHGRYVLKDSGFPVSALYQFFVEGYSNEEVATMLHGLTADDVAKVHAFIDALI